MKNLLYIAIILTFVSPIVVAEKNYKTSNPVKILKIKGNVCKYLDNNCEKIIISSKLETKDIIEVDKDSQIIIKYKMPHNGAFRFDKLTSEHKGSIFKTRISAQNDDGAIQVIGGIERGKKKSCYKFNHITLPANYDYNLILNTALCTLKINQVTYIMTHKSSKKNIIVSGNLMFNSKNIEAGKYTVDYYMGDKLYHSASLNLISKDLYITNLKKDIKNLPTNDEEDVLFTKANILNNYLLIALNRIDSIELKNQTQSNEFSAWKNFAINLSLSQMTKLIN
jgi:hypothetical protein